MKNQENTNYRSKDEHNESVITAYLDKYMYARLYRNYEVVTDKDTQCKGIDVIVRTKNGEVYHDAKAQSSARFIGRPEPTFAMEILTNDKTGRTRKGWFIRNDLDTDMYVLVWVNEAYADYNGRISSPDDIYELEVSVVNKHALKEYIYTVEGLDDSTLEREAYALRDYGKNFTYLTRNCKLVFSQNLKEQPVSLVLPKSILDRFAESRYIVRPGGIRALSKTSA